MIVLLRFHLSFCLSKIVTSYNEFREFSRENLTDIADEEEEDGAQALESCFFQELDDVCARADGIHRYG